MTNKPKYVPMRWCLRVLAVGLAGGVPAAAVLAAAPGWDDPDARQAWNDRWLGYVAVPGFVGFLATFCGGLLTVARLFVDFPRDTARVFRVLIVAAWPPVTAAAVWDVVASNLRPNAPEPAVAAEPAAVTPSAWPFAEPTEASPLDLLDPAAIPAEEGTAGQPPELVAVFGRHRGRPWRTVGAMAVSPDGRTVATGDWLDAGHNVLPQAAASVVRLWDVSTLREVGVLPVAGPGVGDLSYSRDGHWLAVGRRDGVDLWDLAADPPALTQTVDRPDPPPSTLAPLGPERKLVGRCALAPDADRLAVGWGKPGDARLAVTFVERFCLRGGRWERDGGTGLPPDELGGPAAAEPKPEYPDGVLAFAWQPGSARLAVTTGPADTARHGQQTYFLDLHDESDAARAARLRWSVTLALAHALLGVPLVWAFWLWVRWAVRQPAPPRRPDAPPLEAVAEIGWVQLTAVGLAVAAFVLPLRAGGAAAGYHVWLVPAFALTLFALAETARRPRPVARAVLFGLATVLGGMVAMYPYVGPWEVLHPAGNGFAGSPAAGWWWAVVAGIAAVGLGLRFGTRRKPAFVVLGLAAVLGEYGLRVSDRPPPWVRSATAIAGGPVAFAPDGMQAVVADQVRLRTHAVPVTAGNAGPPLNRTDAEGKLYPSDWGCFSADGRTVLQAGYGSPFSVAPAAGGLRELPVPAGLDASGPWLAARAGPTLVTSQSVLGHRHDLRVWDWSAAVPRPLGGPDDRRHGCLAADPSPDGRTLAEWRVEVTPADVRGVFLVHDLRGGRPVTHALAVRPFPRDDGRLYEPTPGTFAAAFGPDGAVVTAYDAGTAVGTWRLDGPAPKAAAAPVPLPAPEPDVAEVAFSPDGHFLATLERVEPRNEESRSYRVLLRDLRPAVTAVHVLVPARARPANFRPVRLGFSADGTTLTLAEAEGDGENRTLVPKLSWAVGGAAPGSIPPTAVPFSEESPAALLHRLSPDGRLVATHEFGGSPAIRVADAAGRAVRTVGLPGRVRDFHFAADARHLVAQNANDTVSVLRLHPAPPAAVALARANAAAAHDPQDAAAHRGRGEALARLGRYAEAKAAFARAAALAPCFRSDTMTWNETDPGVSCLRAAAWGHFLAVRPLDQGVLDPDARHRPFEEVKARAGGWSGRVVVLDLRPVKMFQARTSAVCLQTAITLRKAGRDLWLYRPRPDVAEYFRVTRLHTVFYVATEPPPSHLWPPELTALLDAVGELT